ncbi:hypothetical protein FACS1894110_04380 [Spirochaetia bacterium]|nr:hypothetical protein FACS1894110_04380 [Spirochaetia bacterium]
MNELNRKAMVLGNKLAPRIGGDRKATFVEAWIIVKVGGLTLPVRGVFQGSRLAGACLYSVHSVATFSIRFSIIEYVIDAMRPP